MATVIRTLYCFPVVMDMGDGLLFDARDADHERCPGGYTIKGVMGGWFCPCPCHREPLDSDGSSETMGP